MQHIIKNRHLVTDTCLHLGADDALPACDCTVPLSAWLSHPERLRRHPSRVGVRLQADDDPYELADFIDSLDLIALQLFQLTDGRPYSQARILREHLGYQGELRALGEVFRDQLTFMERCGIDAFELHESHDLESALATFNEFSGYYQPASRRRLNSPHEARMASMRI